ncbi:MAG: TerB family tellurite resistance protein [Vicingus serpentipes]|nr:TerB family tellurite resistance protein [Vicingus serpentipes]
MLNTEQYIKNWDYRHYLAYMYIAVANSDYEISEDDLKVLHDKLAPTIFDEANYQEMYKEVLDVYEQQNDNEVFNLLFQLSKKHITSNEQKEKVLKDIHEIIDADGHETGNETIMFMSIRKILNNSI